MTTEKNSTDKKDKSGKPGSSVPPQDGDKGDGTNVQEQEKEKNTDGGILDQAFSAIQEKRAAWESDDDEGVSSDEQWDPDEKETPSATPVQASAPTPTTTITPAIDIEARKAALGKLLHGGGGEPSPKGTPDAGVVAMQGTKNSPEWLNSPAKIMEERAKTRTPRVIYVLAGDVVGVVGTLNVKEHIEVAKEDPALSRDGVAAIIVTPKGGKDDECEQFLATKQESQLVHAISPVYPARAIAHAAALEAMKKSPENIGKAGFQNIVEELTNVLEPRYVEEVGKDGAEVDRVFRTWGDEAEAGGSLVEVISSGIAPDISNGTISEEQRKKVSDAVDEYNRQSEALKEARENAEKNKGAIPADGGDAGAPEKRSEGKGKQKVMFEGEDAPPTPPRDGEISTPLDKALFDPKLTRLLAPPPLTAEELERIPDFAETQGEFKQQKAQKAKEQEILAPLEDNYILPNPLDVFASPEGPRAIAYLKEYTKEEGIKGLDKDQKDAYLEFMFSKEAGAQFQLGSHTLSHRSGGERLELAPLKPVVEQLVAAGKTVPEAIDAIDAHMKERQEAKNAPPQEPPHVAPLAVAELCDTSINDLENCRGCIEQFIKSSKSSNMPPEAQKEMLGQLLDPRFSLTEVRVEGARGAAYSRNKGIALNEMMGNQASATMDTATEGAFYGATASWKKVLDASATVEEAVQKLDGHIAAYKIKAKDQQERLDNALARATVNGDKKGVELLLHHGANPAAQVVKTKDGNTLTPLHLAAINGNSGVNDVYAHSPVVRGVVAKVTDAAGVPPGIYAERVGGESAFRPVIDPFAEQGSSSRPSRAEGEAGDAAAGKSEKRDPGLDTILRHARDAGSSSSSPDSSPDVSVDLSTLSPEERRLAKGKEKVKDNDAPPPPQHAEASPHAWNRSLTDKKGAYRGVLKYAEEGKTKRLNNILDKNKDLKIDQALNEHGQTALHLAAIKGNGKMVKILLERGAKQYADADGKTPLHWAAWQGHQEVVESLATASDGAEVLNARDGRDGKGKTARDLVIERRADAYRIPDRTRDAENYNEIRKFLEKQGAEIPFSSLRGSGDGGTTQTLNPITPVIKREAIALRPSVVVGRGGDDDDNDGFGESMVILKRNTEIGELPEFPQGKDASSQPSENNDVVDGLDALLKELSVRRQPAPQPVQQVQPPQDDGNAPPALPPRGGDNAPQGDPLMRELEEDLARRQQRGDNPPPQNAGVPPVPQVGPQQGGPQQQPLPQPLPQNNAGGPQGAPPIVQGNPQGGNAQGVPPVPRVGPQGGPQQPLPPQNANNAQSAQANNPPAPGRVMDTRLGNSIQLPDGTVVDLRGTAVAGCIGLKIMDVPLNYIDRLGNQQVEMAIFKQRFDAYRDFGKRCEQGLKEMDAMYMKDFRAQLTAPLQGGRSI